MCKWKYILAILFLWKQFVHQPIVLIPTREKTKSSLLPKPIFILYSRITLNLVKTDGWWRPWFSSEPLEHLGVGVWSLLLSKGGHNVHKAPVVLDATLSTASLLLLLLLLVNLDSATRDMSTFFTTVKFILKDRKKQSLKLRKNVWNEYA